MPEEASLATFLLELDALKLVERRTYVDGGTRLENSAEHSWHVGLAAWALAGYLKLDVDIGKVVQLALIHDLGEMTAGDTFLYATDRTESADRERQGIVAFAGKYEGVLPGLASLWEEQESGATPEAAVLKIADRLLPFLHNLASEGKTWREHGIAKSQVLNAHAFIERDAPELFTWMKGEADAAAQRGWLTDS